MTTHVTDPKGPLYSTKKIPKDQFIVLTIQAEKLYHVDTKDPEYNIDGFCVLQDQEHSSNGWPLNHFISEVFIKRDVTWNGITADEGYPVSIEKINHTPSKLNSYKNFFEKTDIEGTKGWINGNVRDVPDLVDRLYVYSIHFKIHPLGGEPKYFEIDPKLCANT